MRKNAKQGLDGLELEIILHGINEGKTLQRCSLINPYCMEYGHVEAKDGKAQIGICLPKVIRTDNEKPFSITDLIALETIRNDLMDALVNLLGDISDCRLKSIECNITQKVAQRCTPSQVMDLIHRSYYDTKNCLFESASLKCRYLKEKETLLIPKRNYYWIKCYDKSCEQRDKRKRDVEGGLLRIEVVMFGRSIDKLFGANSTVQ